MFLCWVVLFFGFCRVWASFVSGFLGLSLGFVCFGGCLLDLVFGLFLRTCFDCCMILEF